MWTAWTCKSLIVVHVVLFFPNHLLLVVRSGENGSVSHGSLPAGKDIVTEQTIHQLPLSSPTRHGFRWSALLAEFLVYGLRLLQRPVCAGGLSTAVGPAALHPPRLAWSFRPGRSADSWQHLQSCVSVLQGLPFATELLRRFPWKPRSCAAPVTQKPLLRFQSCKCE